MAWVNKKKKLKVRILFSFVAWQRKTVCLNMTIRIILSKFVGKRKIKVEVQTALFAMAYVGHRYEKRTWKSGWHQGTINHIWKAPPRAGKMNPIARCDWLPERARWSHPGLPSWDYPLYPARKIPPKAT